MGENTLFHGLNGEDDDVDLSWSSTAIATSKSTLLELPAQFFQQALQTAPAMQEKLVGHYKQIQNVRSAAFISVSPLSRLFSLFACEEFLFYSGPTI